MTDVMSNATTNEGALWGGRFKSGPAAALVELSRSTQFDWILAPYDIAGSKAHAKALLKAGVLNDEECAKLMSCLDQMALDDAQGELKPQDSDEDVHGALERILIERVGAQIGGKLRAGRSRNDQIATLVRMYLLDQEVLIRKEVVGILAAIGEQAGSALSDPKNPVIMPGRTHLQHAQPVLLSHHLLAHGWSFLRDLDRLRDWKKRAKLSPYGSGALAGQTLGLDASLIAKELNFSGLEYNSIDGVASRDVVSEFLFILTSISINLSRFAEEIIIWNTKEFGFVKLDDGYSTGSSIMPQKKNPDISELARGKAGRIIGDLTGLLATLKAQPLAYNRDLQEDKEPVFDAVSQLLTLLPAFAGQIQSACFNYERMNALAPRGFALATDIAEWLVKQGVPFRVAHELSGECVQKCEDISSTSGKDVELWELADSDFEQILGGALANFGSDVSATQVRSVLSAFGSVSARDGFNGTAPRRVQEQLVNFIKTVNDFR
jgi:argininosuccinate lyase